MAEQYDVVVVGGGIAGSGLATVVARAGKSVLVLEKSEVYQDMVRGEWLAPWGVVDARKAGLYDVLAAENDHHLPYHLEYGDGIEAAEAEAARLDLGRFVPGVPGPMAIGHPQACQALANAATAAGATVLRGTGDVRIEAGSGPSVTYSHGGETHEVRCQLIVGADGRGSTVRRQAGIGLEQEPTHHMFAGLLVHDAHGWDDQAQVIGTEGDLQFFIFPQGKGRLRLYYSHGLDQKSRFSGEDASRKFLDAFQFKTLPNCEAVTKATIAGPCHSIPNQGAKAEAPVAPGIVLVGDAAGYSDPIIGQGLAIAMRDVRLVGEALLGETKWTPETFAPYAEERVERMRRLSWAARLSTLLQAEFGPEATARKLRFRARSAADPTLGLGRAAGMMGPEMLPPQAFTDEEFARVAAV